MLSAILTLLHTIKNIAYFSILVSYKTGQFIVNGLLSSVEALSKLLSTLWTVLVVLNEDLFVFLQDVGNRLGFIARAITQFVDYIAESMSSIFLFFRSIIFGTSDFFGSICQTVTNIIVKIVTTFGNIIAGIKYLIVLFGSGVWFAITLVPVFVVYLCMLITYYIGRTFEEVKTIIETSITKTKLCTLDIYKFVTDVPLESLAGLMVGVCLIYVFAKFHLLVYRSVKRFGLLALTLSLNYLQHLKTMWRRRTATTTAAVEVEDDSDNDLSSLSTDSDEEYTEERLPELVFSSNPGWPTKKQRNQKLKEEAANTLCVICLERSKCILSMPCRHLCMCHECNETLRRYQQNCPVCRRYVNYTIHVY